MPMGETLGDQAEKAFKAEPGDGVLTAPTSAKKPPISPGRPPGALSKERKDLLALIRQAVGDEDWHPVAAMARIAFFSHYETVDPITGDKVRLVPEMEQRVKCLSEVSKYVAPQLRAVEHSGSVEHNVAGVLRVPVGLSEDAWVDTARPTVVDVSPGAPGSV